LEILLWYNIGLKGEVMIASKNKPQSEMTADPSKYPQGYFKEKACRKCGTVFKPQAPSHLYCSQTCADEALADRYYKRVYGILAQDYKDMFEKQKGLCAICYRPGFNMKDLDEPQLVVDHCHSTGKVRGLLCHNCNRGLGLFQDLIEVVNNAKLYLEGATTIPTGSTLKRVEAPDTPNG
jgi:hypothetical protein